jgi:hypothetical protein
MDCPSDCFQEEGILSLKQKGDTLLLSVTVFQHHLKILAG